MYKDIYVYGKESFFFNLNWFWGDIQMGGIKILMLGFILGGGGIGLLNFLKGFYYYYFDMVIISCIKNMVNKVNLK